MGLIGKIKFEKPSLIFGLTGNIASGKTYACQKLAEIADENNFEFHHIEIDAIRRNILLYSEKPEHINIRKVLIEHLNLKVNLPFYAISGDILGEKIFFDAEAMQFYRDIMNREIFKLASEKIKTLKGLIVVEWAMLLEDNLLSLVKNNVILLTCDSKMQQKRLLNSDLPSLQLQKRIQMQNSFKQKKMKILKQQNLKARFITVDTTENPPKEIYEKLFLSLLS